MVRLYQETLIPVLLPVPFPVFVPIQDLPQSQSVAIKTPNPLISLFWRRTLSLLIVSGRRVIGRTAKLRCSGSTPLGASKPL
jgi:hypothetical protein